MKQPKNVAACHCSGAETGCEHAEWCPQDQINWCLVLKRFEIAWLGHGSKRPTSGVLYAIANRNGAPGLRWGQTPHDWYQCPWYRKPYSRVQARAWYALHQKKAPIA